MRYPGAKGLGERMSASAKRQKITAIKAAKLALEGRTTRQIAEETGIKPEQVAKRIILGQRLMQVVEALP